MKELEDLSACRRVFYKAFGFPGNRLTVILMRLRQFQVLKVLGIASVVLTFHSYLLLKQHHSTLQDFKQKANSGLNTVQKLTWKLPSQQLHGGESKGSYLEQLNKDVNASELLKVIQVLDFISMSFTPFFHEHSPFKTDGSFEEDFMLPGTKPRLAGIASSLAGITVGVGVTLGAQRTLTLKNDGQLLSAALRWQLLCICTLFANAFVNQGNSRFYDQLEAQVLFNNGLLMKTNALFDQMYHELIAEIETDSELMASNPMAAKRIDKLQQSFIENNKTWESVKDRPLLYQLLATRGTVKRVTADFQKHVLQPLEDEEKRRDEHFAKKKKGSKPEEVEQKSTFQNAAVFTAVAFPLSSMASSRISLANAFKRVFRRFRR